MNDQTSFPERLRLTGEGLTLREWGDDDLAVMRDLFDDAEVAYWTPLASPFDEAAARTYFDNVSRRRRDNHTLQLAITTDGVRPLGEILLIRSEHGLEVGYSVGPSHRGQGLATRAVRVITEYAHTELGAPEVVLELEADNAASVGVARGSGFSLLDRPLISAVEKGRSLVLQTWGHHRRAREC